MIFTKSIPITSGEDGEVTLDVPEEDTGLLHLGVITDMLKVDALLTRPEVHELRDGLTAALGKMTEA